jgi:ribosomal protein S18 acetylase RimI-like enzyme
VANDDIRIESVTAVDQELVEAFELLIPQLSSSNPPPPAEDLQAIVDDADSVLLIARDDLDDGRIVGSLTLAMFRIPTGYRAWIEDVVVDTAVRGRGIGDKLNRVALDLARDAGATTVDLTSRPSREAANRLYKRIGFEQRETNVYRFKL